MTFCISLKSTKLCRRVSINRACVLQSRWTRTPVASQSGSFAYFRNNDKNIMAEANAYHSNWDGRSSERQVSYQKSSLKKKRHRVEPYSRDQNDTRDQQHHARPADVAVGRSLVDGKPPKSLVGGRLPDRYHDYLPFSKSFVVPRLPIRGIVPCRVFLDPCFDNRPGNPGKAAWTPLDLLSITEFKEASNSDGDGDGDAPDSAKEFPPEDEKESEDEDVVASFKPSCSNGSSEPCCSQLSNDHLSPSPICSSRPLSGSSETPASSLDAIHPTIRDPLSTGNSRVSPIGAVVNLCFTERWEEQGRVGDGRRIFLSLPSLLLLFLCAAVDTTKSRSFAKPAWNISDFRLKVVGAFRTGFQWIVVLRLMHENRFTASKRKQMNL